MNGIQQIIGNFGELDWRAVVVLCIVVVTIYFVVMVLRFLQLPRHDRDVDVYRTQDLRAPEMRTPPPEFDARPGTALAGIWESPAEPRLDGLFAPAPLRAAPTDAMESMPTSPAAAAPQPIPLRAAAFAPEPAAGEFGQQLTQKTLESEVRQLRDQLAESRAEILRMREEMARLSAAQKVSPLYNEAMGMAIRGVDAAGIAGRCGISIAEAELVVALSRRPDAEADGDGGGGGDDATDAEQDREDDGYGRRA